LVCRAALPTCALEVAVGFNLNDTRADLLLSECSSPDDVKQVLIKNGSWQNMTVEQQSAFMRHLNEEHLTPDHIGELATRAKVKKVVLTHLSLTVNPNENYQRLATEVKKFFSGEVVVAKDLMSF
jgi:ribonuclease BN (tRNA processing enzyme)